MARFCFEIERSYRHEEYQSIVGCTIYDRSIGYKFPIGHIYGIEYAQRVVDLLNGSQEDT